MTDRQFALPGLLPPLPAHNLFFAVLPPDEIASDAMRVRNKMATLYGLRGTAVRRACLHVSLLGLGTVAPDDPRLRRVLAPDSMTMTGSAFVRFDRFTRFRISRVSHAIVLRAEEDLPALEDLRARLRVTLSRCRLKARSGGFRPHMTLMYAEADAAGALDDEIDPFVWTAPEIVLVRSHVGQTRHEVLGRWPLG